MTNKIEDIMTEQVTTVTKDTPLTEAAVLLSDRGYNGLPVVDADGRLIGMFNERNIISDKSYVKLKTVIQLLSEMKFYKKDTSPLRNELKDVINLKVNEVMNLAPTVIKPDDSIELAAALFADQNNNPLPVVSDDGKLVGVIALSDLTRYYGVVYKKMVDEKDVNKKIDKLVNKFEREFTVVTNFRVSTWFVTSVMFALVGFAIAMFMILRIS
jgi:CBS domain-containing protein